MEIIVTDLTKFKGDAIRCVAGIDPISGKCVRPLPYFRAIECQDRQILPGVRLSGDFMPDSRARKPHIEDHVYQRVSKKSPVSLDSFRSALKNALYDTIEDGFEVELSGEAKHITISQQPARSIITLRPGQLQVISSQFGLKVTFSDGSGKYFNYLSVTDLGLNDYVQEMNPDEAVALMNIFFQSQRELFLRIGLSRQYRSSDGRDGFWLQVNGIYSFPDCFQTIGCIS